MRAIGFPLVYRQGAEILDSLGEYTRIYGTKALVVSDAFVRELYAVRLETALKKRKIAAEFTEFAGQPSPEELSRLVTVARESGCDFVSGFGGGKTQDASKVVKKELGIPVVIVPTIASSDAATSRLAITYTRDGGFLGPVYMDTNPDAVLVDSGIIVNAPVRFFIAGIGDALSTYFEAEQCRMSGVENFFAARQTETAIAISRHCYDVVWRRGAEAVHAVRNGELCDAVEDVIEASVLMSGLGFEGCGVAAAHAISQGFTCIDALHGNLHGEEVAVALLSQFVLEQRDDGFIRSMVQFYRAVGIPVSLRALGLTKPASEHFNRIAEFACRENSRIYNMNRPISVADVVDALRVVESLDEEYGGEDGGSKRHGIS